ncbi:DUF2938 domain-containing protein [Halococcus sediminicola]|uniref:DUF2938 domain-containing protein n=1 Tax=Halococcus sediminicola TaxID=1264579 RepID=UPI000678E8CE|nr:DUF2938 domain-containing protein [Halococcus sediminicola]
MNEELELVIRVALIGVGATVIMDIWALFLKHAFGISSLDNRMVGRWFGHFSHGSFMHNNIRESSPIPGERIIGWSAHYVIGITWAGILLAIWGLDWARHPTLLPALIVGLATLVAPFLIMQPGMGIGIAASKTPNPNVARLKSIAAHTVYGIGLYSSALLSALLIQP